MGSFASYSVKAVKHPMFCLLDWQLMLRNMPCLALTLHVSLKWEEEEEEEEDHELTNLKDRSLLSAVKNKT